MQLNLIFQYIPYALITNFTPGPNNILALNSARTYGLAKSKNILFGICSGFTCVLLICGFLCISLNNFTNIYQGGMKYLGSIYLCWLAIHIFMNKPDKEIMNEYSNTSFWAGFLAQFLNVKVMLYGMVSISSFVLPYTQSLLVIFSFIIGMSILGALAALTWAIVGSKFQIFLNEHYKIANIVMGVILLKSAFDLLIK